MGGGGGDERKEGREREREREGGGGGGGGGRVTRKQRETYYLLYEKLCTIVYINLRGMRRYRFLERGPT